MNADQLSKAFEKLADDDSSLELRFRKLDTLGNVTALSVDAKRGTTTRFKLLAEDAAEILELSGCAELWQRWAMRLPDTVPGVAIPADHSGDLAAVDDGGTVVAVLSGWDVRDAARVSAHAFGRLWRERDGAPDPEAPKPEPDTVAGDTGSIQRTNGVKAGRFHGMQWQKVQERLETLRSQGEKFTSQDVLAKRLGCSQSNISKAINKSPKLKGWVERSRSPRAESLTEVGLDNIEQTREAAPEIGADSDAVLNTLKQECGNDPEVTRWLKESSEEEQQVLAKLLHDQKGDYERSPLDGAGHPAVEHKRV